MSPDSLLSKLKVHSKLDYRDLSYASLHPRQKDAVANYGGGGKDAGHVPQRHGDTRGNLYWQE